MKIAALIVNVENVAGKSKRTGSDYAFNVVKFLDTEAKKSDLLSSMIPDNMLVELAALKGKLVSFNCSLSGGYLDLDSFKAA